MSNYIFNCPDEECVSTLHDVETSTLNCNKAKKILVNKFLRLYGMKCTTSIIIAACNDCGSLSEDCEMEFDAVDLMDPGFPFTMEDEPRQSTGEYLAQHTSSSIEEVVAVLKAMEYSWEKRVTSMNLDQYSIAKKLWEIGRNMGHSKFDYSHGVKVAEEFKEIGDDLFRN